MKCSKKSFNNDIIKQIEYDPKYDVAGKEAWEVDKLIGKEKKPMFTMLRFLDSNRVLVAMPTKTNDGSTKEKIKNHFNPNSQGCQRVK